MTRTATADAAEPVTAPAFPPTTGQGMGATGGRPWRAPPGRCCRPGAARAGTPDPGLTSFSPSPEPGTRTGNCSATAATSKATPPRIQQQLIEGAAGVCPAGRCQPRTVPALPGAGGAGAG